MKNQYFGDINDYRKYGLLRALAETSRLGIGVCWLLTPNDTRGDGELRKYLLQPDKWRRYDPGLYDALRRLLQGGIDRSVCHARDWDLIPGAEYFERILVDGAAARGAYFSEASVRLAGCHLWFLDPDNGIEVSSSPSWPETLSKSNVGKADSKESKGGAICPGGAGPSGGNGNWSSARTSTSGWRIGASPSLTFAVCLSLRLGIIRTLLRVDGSSR